MMRFCQPSDYRYGGKNIWINTKDIVTIVACDNSYKESIVTLRDGRSFTLSGDAEELSKKVNEDLELE